MEKIIVEPREVRGLGDIVSPKSVSDFLVHNGAVYSGSDSDYGTVYTETYKAGSRMVVDDNYWKIDTCPITSFTVWVRLEKMDETRISGEIVSCTVNNDTVLTATTSSLGIASFTIPVVDGVVEYTCNFMYAGSSSVAGCFAGGTYRVGKSMDYWELDLIGESSIIQSGDRDVLLATLTGEDCSGDRMGVRGQVVYFFEEWTPNVRLSGEANIIQSGDTDTLTAQLIDNEDGSIVKESGHTVYFYKDVTSFTDALTSDNGTFILSDTDGGLSFDSNGMKFIQNGSTNNKTFCYIPMVLDVANMAYEIEFDYVSSYTTDNTPFRCCICKASDMSFASWMPLVNTTAGWLINGTWTKTNYQNFTNGDVIKIRLEDGAYKVWRNGSQVATNDLVVGEPVFFGFEHWKTNYIVIKNLKFSEVDE